MGRRSTIVAVVVMVLGLTTAGLALAQSRRGATRSREDVMHVVLSPDAHIQLFDFNGHGFGLGDRLASVGPILDGSGNTRVGTSYADCWVGDKTLVEGSPYVCTYVLRLGDGEIMTEGLDPHGPSDVLFAVTGGTGAYDGASGQAEYIDTTQTDIYIHLDE